MRVLECLDLIGLQGDCSGYPPRSAALRADEVLTIEGIKNAKYSALPMIHEQIAGIRHPQSSASKVRRNMTQVTSVCAGEGRYSQVAPDCVELLSWVLDEFIEKNRVGESCGLRGYGVVAGWCAWCEWADGNTGGCGGKV